MINTSIKVKIVTLDDLKSLESAKDEKTFFEFINKYWKLTNTTDGLYIENIDYTAEGLSTEDLAAFLGIDTSKYSVDDDGYSEALQNDLSDAYQMRDDEVDARVCWLARDEIISEAREVFEESHLYTKEDDTEHLRYIKPATYEEMEDDFERVYSKADLEKRSLEDNAAQMLGYAINSFIKWKEEEEQGNAILQSLKKRLVENSALAFDKAFRASLAEELQKLIK